MATASWGSRSAQAMYSRCGASPLHQSAREMIGLMARPLLGVGRVGLHGRVPNGQRFIANPRTLWAVVDSSAQLAGTDFGPPGPIEPQAHLGDFWIPQRGILAMGQTYFDAFDAALHSANTSRSPARAV